MKRKIIIALMIMIVLICGAYFLLVKTLDWKEESRKKAPGSNLIAFHMMSRSEAGPAPYGDHVMLVPRYELFGQYFISPVFAGYCGQTFEYQWIDRQTLEITCTDGKILKKESSSNGVNIKYKLLKEGAGSR